MSTMEDFDRWVSDQLDPVRDQPIANRLMYLASALGDDGRLWLGLAAGQLFSPGRRRRGLDQALWIGIESAIVNGPMKFGTKRSRPAPRATHAHHFRPPGGSSFPSGHAASAFTMATMLAEGGGVRLLWFVPAGIVASSRVHVGVHHPTDVIAGAIVGIGFGLAGRRLHLVDRLVNKAIELAPGEQLRRVIERVLPPSPTGAEHSSPPPGT